ncbi:MAG: hypothetical protein AAF384_06465 [Pseudomonadota bacterium]
MKDAMAHDLSPDEAIATPDRFNHGRDPCPWGALLVEPSGELHATEPPQRVVSFNPILESYYAWDYDAPRWYSAVPNNPSDMVLRSDLLRISPRSGYVIHIMIWGSVDNSERAVWQILAKQWRERRSGSKRSLESDYRFT